MKTSKLFDLGKRDFINGFIIAILAPAVLIIQQSLDAGIWTFNWKLIAMASISGAIAYLSKNFFTNSKGSLFGRDDDDSTKPKPRP